jgi:hypothetical protein
VQRNPRPVAPPAQLSASDNGGRATSTRKGDPAPARERNPRNPRTLAHRETGNRVAKQSCKTELQNRKTGKGLQVLQDLQVLKLPQDLQVPQDLQPLQVLQDPQDPDATQTTPNTPTPPWPRDDPLPQTKKTKNTLLRERTHRNTHDTHTQTGKTSQDHRKETGPHKTNRATTRGTAGYVMDAREVAERLPADSARPSLFSPRHRADPTLLKPTTPETTGAAKRCGSTEEHHRAPTERYPNTQDLNGPAPSSSTPNRSPPQPVGTGRTDAPIAQPSRRFLHQALHLVGGWHPVRPTSRPRSLRRSESPFHTESGFLTATSHPLADALHDAVGCCSVVHPAGAAPAPLVGAGAALLLLPYGWRGRQQETGHVPCSGPAGLRGWFRCAGFPSLRGGGGYTVRHDDSCSC